MGILRTKPFFLQAALPLDLVHHILRRNRARFPIHLGRHRAGWSEEIADDHRRDRDDAINRRLVGLPLHRHQRGTIAREIRPPGRVLDGQLLMTEVLLDRLGS